MPDIIQGQTKRITFECRDAAGALVDPASVHFIYKYGDTKTTLIYGTDAALVRDNLGKYHVDLTVAAFGEWKYRVVITAGKISSPIQDTFYVAPALL